MTTTETKTAIKAITLVFRGGKELYLTVPAAEADTFLADLMKFDGAASDGWGCIVKQDSRQVYIRPNELQAIQVDEGDDLAAFGKLSGLFGLGR